MCALRIIIRDLAVCLYKSCLLLFKGNVMIQYGQRICLLENNDIRESGVLDYTSSERTREGSLVFPLVNGGGKTNNDIFFVWSWRQMSKRPSCW